MTQAPTLKNANAVALLQNKLDIFLEELVASVIIVVLVVYESDELKDRS